MSDQDIVNLNRKRELKNGESTPETVVSLLHEAMEEKECEPEGIIYICKMKDGRIETRHSKMLNIECLGLLQMASHSIIEGSKND